MKRMSAGILLYRFDRGELQVFLVHPGGPFWARKDEGAWSIPKGEYATDEDPLMAAQREFAEETGIELPGPFAELEPVKQAGGKTVRAWATQGDCDPSSIVSNTFEMEWPPRSGKRVSFPEVDRAAWFDVTVARTRLLKGQVPLLDQLVALLMA